MFPMISTWIPPQERSRLASVIWSGSNFGTFVTLPISALLSDQFGWSSSFYFFGTLGILWSFCFIFLCFDSPSRHPRISQEERDYIESSFPHKPKSEDTKLPNPPFRKIITSIPVYALMFTHIGNNWGMYTLLTEIPTYLNDIQHISLKSVSCSAIMVKITS
jgi:sugar phosphate permease